MHTREQKLAAVLGDADLASSLSAAGFDLPSKIKAATDKELKEVAGLTTAEVKKVRGRIKRA